MAVTDITRTFVVTGPTRGLGRETTLDLAARGHRLVLLGRSSAALTEVSSAARSAGAAEVHVIAVDLSSLAETRRAAQDLIRQKQAGAIPSIDVVVANAGLQFDTRDQATIDGYETTFAVNVMANHLLLTQLVDHLDDGAHVVVVGSGTHFGQPPATFLVPGPVWDTPTVLATPGGPMARQKKSGPRAYATSKLGVNYLVHELQRRYPDRARWNVYDPGLMPGTGLARETSAVRRFAWNKIMPALVVLPGVTTPKHSGRTLARFALGLDHADLRGGYVEITKRSKASDESFNESRQTELWNFCAAAAPPVG
jgi:NAD(P)-dependent dehydrogenase (short-subunit alcohol dehydrogenase family)